MSFWKNEPLRTRIYGLAVLIAGYLLVRGYIDATDAAFIGSAAALILGVETARAKVTPTRKLTPPAPPVQLKTATLKLDGEEIVKAIKAYNRKRGQRSAGI